MVIERCCDVVRLGLLRSQLRVQQLEEGPDAHPVPLSGKPQPVLGQHPVVGLDRDRLIVRQQPVVLLAHIRANQQLPGAPELLGILRSRGCLADSKVSVELIEDRQPDRELRLERVVREIEREHAVACNDGRLGVGAEAELLSAVGDDGSIQSQSQYQVLINDIRVVTSRNAGHRSRLRPLQQKVTVGELLGEPRPRCTEADAGKPLRLHRALGPFGRRFLCTERAYVGIECVRLRQELFQLPCRLHYRECVRKRHQRGIFGRRHPHLLKETQCLDDHALVGLQQPDIALAFGDFCLSNVNHRHLANIETGLRETKVLDVALYLALLKFHLCLRFQHRDVLLYDAGTKGHQSRVNGCVRCAQRGLLHAWLQQSVPVEGPVQGQVVARSDRRRGLPELGREKPLDAGTPKRRAGTRREVRDEGCIRVPNPPSRRPAIVGGPQVTRVVPLGQAESVLQRQGLGYGRQSVLCGPGGGGAEQHDAEQWDDTNVH